jgi:lysophospholipase L1-like esterase
VGGAGTGGTPPQGGAGTSGGTGAGGVSNSGGMPTSGGSHAGNGGGGSGAVAGHTNSGGSAGSAGSAQGGAAGGAAQLANVTLYLASDSTVQTYTDSSIHQGGWGQFLGDYFIAKAKVENHAIGGRTARRFIDEGYLDEIVKLIHAGDYLFVQFGTNDGNKTATYELNGATVPYYLDPQTDFKTWMLRYVTAARAHQANPVFVTPPPRLSCTGDSHTFGNSLGGYATAMKELGLAESVPVVDLNQKTLSYLNQIGCVAAGRDFFLIKADGTNDSTHFQENGANVMAGFVAAGVRELGLGLSPYVKVSEP